MGRFRPSGYAKKTCGGSPRHIGHMQGMSRMAGQRDVLHVGSGTVGGGVVGSVAAVALGPGRGGGVCGGRGPVGDRPAGSAAPLRLPAAAGAASAALALASLVPPARAASAAIAACALTCAASLSSIQSKAFSRMYRNSFDGNLAKQSFLLATCDITASTPAPFILVLQTGHVNRWLPHLLW